MRREKTMIASNPKISFMNLPVANLLLNPKKDWENISVDSRKNMRLAFRKISVDWEYYNPRDFLFTHSSIVSSVATDTTGYRILAPCDELVNANGNAWTNQVIPHCFKTFIGKDNFSEHQQIPELSKGKILDAVLRPVVYIGREGKKADVFYVDILIATNRKHEEIVERVEAGELSTLSMGAIANVTQCSFCGKIVRDSEENCQHLDGALNKFMEDENGNIWKVAELVGALDASGAYIPNSCEFIEASWVEQPAFEGAVTNFILNDGIKTNMIVSDTSEKLAMLFEDEKSLAKLKVADRKSVMAIRLALNEMREKRYLNTAQNVLSLF